MPNASSTQSSSACETTGQPIPLSYGYVWATGKREAYYMLQDTGTAALDYTRAGFWKLGHGEWDGLQELWIDDVLSWRGNPQLAAGGAGSWMGWDWYQTLDSTTQNLVWHFHSGCDAVIGSGLAPHSTGPDQGCDTLWSVFPPAIQPLCWSRIAYYAIMRKQAILYQQNNNQGDPSQWTDVNPIGLWRALRCRIFDANGNVIGYAWTRNPIWHWVDVYLRRELFPDYNLIYNVGPDPLPAAVSARFDWEPIYDSAQYCNQLLANGRPRFTHDNSYTSASSVQAITTKILRCARAYKQDSQGKIAAICDMPRASVFIFSRDHMMPGSFEPSDQVLNTAGNRILGGFRDLLVPACNNILSITNPVQGDPTVTTDSIPPTGEPQPHPFQQGDAISMGGTGTVYDGEWTVSSVPAILNPGTPDEVDPTTFTIARKGNNYPTTVGAGGAVGLLYSRFKERVPEFWHKNNMLARGAKGLNIARQRNKLKDALDFGTSTYDQVSRLCRYERDRNLGFDQSAYITPPRFKFRTNFFAKDVNGQLAAGIECGDRVTLDNTFRYPYTADYEVLDNLTKTPPACELASPNKGLARTPSDSSGLIELMLQPYNEGYMYETSDLTAAGWPSVPDSEPGNDFSFTAIPLADGGNFVFFAGQLYSGSIFQLPSTGYPANNLMAWASPAGANTQYSSAHTVQQCSTDVSRLLTLVYAGDPGQTWGGDANYAALTWLSADVTSTDGAGMTWLPLTLLGGEEILFGQGIVAHGGTVELPAGWTTAQCFALAFIHDMPASANIMYLAGAAVNLVGGNLVVSCECQDHVGNVWTGNASVLVFAWKNNMGTVTTETLGAETWIAFPLTDGSTFGLGCIKNIGNGSTVALPSSAVTNIADTLSIMCAPTDASFYTSGGGHAQGVGSCYVDAEDMVHCTFNDGSGDIWASSADVLCIYGLSAAAPPTVVSVSPASSLIPMGVTIQLTATVTGNPTTTVTWSVDGVPGGSATVGTIDSAGNYTSPLQVGTHTITATSTADGTATGSATVVVNAMFALSASMPGGTVTIEAGGTTVFTG